MYYTSLFCDTQRVQRVLNREGIFLSLRLRNGEDTVVLLFCCPVFSSSFIQSCKAAVWCHPSQSACTSRAALIGRNDLRMSLATLIHFSPCDPSALLFSHEPLVLCSDADESRPRIVPFSLQPLCQIIYRRFTYTVCFHMRPI